LDGCWRIWGLGLLGAVCWLLGLLGWVVFWVRAALGLVLIWPLLALLGLWGLLGGVVWGWSWLLAGCFAGGWAAAGCSGCC